MLDVRSVSESVCLFQAGMGKNLMTPTNLTDEGLMEMAAIQADWGQVVRNGGPPCFHICSDKRFCLRAERWVGHPDHHAFVSLATLLQQVRDAAKKEDIEILKEQFAAAKCKSCKMSFFKAENRIKWSVTAIRQMEGGK